MDSDDVWCTALLLIGIALIILSAVVIPAGHNNKQEQSKQSTLCIQHGGIWQDDRCIIKEK